MGELGLEKEVANPSAQERPGRPILLCPECGSTSNYRDGFRKEKGRTVQRHLCRSCGRRFSDSIPKNEVDIDIGRKSSEGSHPYENLPHDVVAGPDLVVEVGGDDSLLLGEKDVASGSKIKSGQGLNNAYSCDTSCQTNGDEPILAATQIRVGTEVAGEVNKVESHLFQYIWYLKKRGNADQTIKSREGLLRILINRGADIFDPESVKKTISIQKWVNKRKCNAVDAYTQFLRMLERTWEAPRYQVIRELPFIPKEAELDALIAGSSPVMATFLQILKETAVRRGEAHNLLWSDIDFETNTIRITPEKGSNPRIIKVSKNLIAMLQNLKVKSRVTDPNRVFQKKIRNTMESFRKYRRKIAWKTGNPRILQIHFHTFRHWKATMLYHQTKDPLRVQQFLGHTTFQHTQLYIQLESALFQDTEDDYLCKTAITADEAKLLIEVGFEYVNEIQGIHLYKKRK